MTALDALCPPVLSCAEAGELERKLFNGDEAREWAAMSQAGASLAEALLRDAEEIGGLGRAARLLVLVGKGHNGGDALIATRQLLERLPSARAAIHFAFGERALRPLAERAWRALAHAARDRVTSIAQTAEGDRYDLALDGIFGFQFKPPADERLQALFRAVNAADVRMRVAVDLPSAGLFRADFTYATGSVKRPALETEMAGRVRYLDLGFFDPASAGGDQDRVLTPAVLEPLRGFRRAHSDKRSYGHVFLIGGSRSYPGALLMSAMAAVRSGAGLVTVFAPESLAASFAAQLPEAMWVACPETPGGGLALEGEHLVRERWERADALVVGPGLGREPETLALARSVAQRAVKPLVLDADALQPDIVLAGVAPRVLTPHAGEFARIAGTRAPAEVAREHPELALALKGPTTRIYAAGRIFHSCFGGPVLARGGSGDILAGLIGAQLAQGGEPTLAAARGVVWQGLAADHLARAHGAVAVRTTQLLDHLADALR